VCGQYPVWQLNTRTARLGSTKFWSSQGLRSAPRTRPTVIGEEVMHERRLCTLAGTIMDACRYGPLLEYWRTLECICSGSCRQPLPLLIATEQSNQALRAWTRRTGTPADDRELRGTAGATTALVIDREYGATRRAVKLAAYRIRKGRQPPSAFPGVQGIQRLLKIDFGRCRSHRVTVRRQVELIAPTPWNGARTSDVPRTTHDKGPSGKSAMNHISTGAAIAIPRR
jgi:hypothetical protein